MAEKKLKVTLIKSTIGAVPKNKKTIEALGLSKLYKTVELTGQRCNSRRASQGCTICESRRSLK